MFRLQPVCLFPSWVEWKSNLQRVQDYCRHARESQQHSELFNLGKQAHLQVKAPGVYKAMRRRSLNSAEARSWLTTASLVPVSPLSYVLMLKPLGNGSHCISCHYLGYLYPWRRGGEGHSQQEISQDFSSPISLPEICSVLLPWASRLLPEMGLISRSQTWNSLN